jgi:hypothetical protein
VRVRKSTDPVQMFWTGSKFVNFRKGPAVERDSVAVPSMAAVNDDVIAVIETLDGADENPTQNFL